MGVGSRRLDELDMNFAKVIRMQPLICLEKLPHLVHVIHLSESKCRFRRNKTLLYILHLIDFLSQIFDNSVKENQDFCEVL